jgi:hypothetical protein
MTAKFNIQELMRGRWVTRYQKDMSLVEARKKFEWLTTTPYWLEKADDFRIVQIYTVVAEIERYNS